MVRASSSKSSKKADDDKNVERTRLKNLAIKKRIVSETPDKAFTPLGPTKQVVKHHGKDILRKSSQRKNRFLFSFPGLLGPLGGGKIGELKNLGTQNPVLYLDFPQGQMKLFGTIVYPETKYLTLQFSRGGKSVMCEDYFDNMIIFSDAWWIGRKDENPDEIRLDFPKELSEGQHAECDFKGGAGAAAVNKQGGPTTGVKVLEEGSPEAQSEDEFSDVEKKLKDKMEVTPVRHSKRTAGKSFKFVDVSSEDDPVESDADLSEGEEKKVGTELDNSTSNDIDGNACNPRTVVLGIDGEDVEKKNYSSKEISSSIHSVTKSRKLSESAATETKSKENLCSHGSLVQATISTLFKKVEEKNAPSSSRKSSASKASGQKLQHNDLKRSSDQVEVFRKKEKVVKEKSRGTRNTPAKKKKANEVEEDDIEEFSNTSQDSDGSDDDWTA
ncbi:hypothetical protein LWI28_018397 [Acer negundo]|uniref:DNA-binding protein RHL1 n=1 Tax=Acer negundo TaxID=4023 RepID=A0AAD5IRQ7_ACENE|nr:hypothetical protein LWI28_018397 [Acer negundo]KAK4843219.1 hypothetical protein QYF36_005479 [Acer negundo]